MIYLIPGLVIFLGIHCLPMLPAQHAAIKARLGEGAYRGLYSAVAAIGLVLIVYGFGAARAEGPLQLYDPPFWLRHVTMLLMLPVFVLLIAAYFPGRIKAALKHPMLAAVKIWALAHLLANGDLASVLLFGGFLVWAVADRISLKRRGPSTVPAVAGPAGRNDAIAVLGGLVLYGLFVWKVHGWLIGVPVI